jgi:transcriptional regulator with XRE-family HTH domain
MSTTAKLKLTKRLKQLRKEYDYTQEKLAQLADIDYKYLQRIEGNKPPAVKIDTLEKLAKAFKISISKLLDF